MNYKLPLDEMTTEEKLEVMESIWEDLCRNPEAVPSPARHASVLNERAAKVQQGEEQITGWEEAKKRMRKAGT